MAGWAICGTSYADTIIGSPGAGFQSWTVSFNNLNTNSAPYWDYPTHYPASNVPGFPPFSTDPPGQFANVGFCLTGTINCPEQFLNPGPPPGPIPFWGMSYDSVADTGGALDRKFFFKRDTPIALQATLELQLSRFANEINEFGWFETDETGSIIVQRHRLFTGSGFPFGSSTPDPVGTTVTFTPTQFYGYYFIDFSEAFCPPIFTVLDLPNRCTEPGSASPDCPPNGGVPEVPNICTTPLSDPSIDPSIAIFSQHSLAVFATDPSSPLSSFWIAGLNGPRECFPPPAADCNLTLGKVAPIPAINSDLTFVPKSSTFSTTSSTQSCPSGFVGKFSFSATLENISNSPLTNLIVKVATLTDGNLLENADGGPGGVVVTLTPPKTSLNPGESEDVPFVICLTEIKPFDFFVDVLGVEESPNT